MRITTVRSVCPLVLAAAVAAALPALAFAQATEDAHIADSGALPIAVQSVPSPLAIWLPPPDVLYDNGPVASGTEPSCSGDTGNASILETALGGSTIGFGSQVLAGNRMADDFEVPAGAGWTLTNAYVFSYQTGSTSTSTFTATNFRIWDGPPDAGGNIVCGDGATNTMSATQFSGIYRMTDTTAGCTRPLMVETVSLAGCPLLPPGTYWLDYQLDGSLGSGPWVPPLVVPGQTTTGNALQFLGSSSTWGPALDTGSAAQQGVPFLLSGTSAGSLHVDTASATATDQCATAPGQNNGVIEPGEHVQITVPVEAVGSSFTTVNASLGLPAPAGVTYVVSSVSLGDIASGNSATANFEIAMDVGAACLSTIMLPIAISATEGNAADSLNLDIGTAGQCTVCIDAADLIFRDGFDVATP